MARPDEAESRVWAAGFDQPVPAMVARAVGLDRHNMEPAKFAAWVRTMIETLDAADAIGREGIARALDRVSGFASKRAAMADHLASGGCWLDIEEALGIPWHEQVRILSHNRPTHLWTWDEERRYAFEADVRDGRTVAYLCRTYGPLSNHLCRSLVNMIRGNIRAS